MKVSRIISNIAGADMAAAKRFYQDVLGPESLRTWDGPRLGVSLADDRYYVATATASAA